MEEQENEIDNNLKGTVEDFEYCEVMIKETEKKIALSSSDNCYANRKSFMKLISEDKGPLVSILVVAFNNLEKYTKTCIKSILKYTQDIDYELVLVDNGSSDGTYEYFKSVPHKRKKIIRVTENKGAVYGSYIGLDCMRGQYIVGIANDIFVTKDWLKNMIICAEADERIGLIGQASDNISNNQKVDLDFQTLEEMQAKAKKFNLSDPRKWEERLRLVGPIAFFRKECLDLIGFTDVAFIHDFGDDDITFRVRRAGYKAILCNDVFVHHAGSVNTGSNLNEKVDIIKKGKDLFSEKYYGIDAWGDVNNFEFAMMSLVNPEDKRGAIKPEILGIDIRCGTPILQLKNKLRLAEIYDTKLSAFVRDAKYWLDLKTICDGEVKVDRIDFLYEHFNNQKFDYIILGESLNKYKDSYKLLDELFLLLKSEGHLLIKIRNNYDARAFLNILGKSLNVDNEIVSHVDIDVLNGYIIEKGYRIEKLVPEMHHIEENTKNFLLDAVIRLNPLENVDSVFNKMQVKDYILDIVRVNSAK